MTTRVSSTELYDNQSVIVKLKRIEDKVDGAEQSVLAHVTEAQEASTDAQSYAGQAQAAAQGMTQIRDQAQASAVQAGQSASTAQAVLTEVRQTAAQAETTARTVATEVVNEKTQTMKSEITAELGTDIEEAKDKADLAYTTASGFGTAITNMQSAVNTTQQEMSNVRTTAQNASQQATQTQGNLDLFKTQVTNTYATKTELNGKADTTTVDTLTQTVNGKLTRTEADGYYQPIGDYLTETVADGKYQPKGEYGASVWGQITGNVEDQTDLTERIDTAKNGAVNAANAYTDEEVERLEGLLDGKQDAGNYALKSEIPDVSGLETSAHAQATYQPKGEYVTKGEIAGVYTFRGTKSTKAQLPDEGNIVGDVWNVASTGMNYAWDGSDWDALGMDVDLSDYVTVAGMKEYVVPIKDGINERIDTIDERVKALEPKEGTFYNELPVFTESEADLNRLTQLIDGNHFIILALEPSMLESGDFGTIVVDPTQGDFVFAIMYFGEGDPRHLFTIEGTQGEWQFDGQWIYMDGMQSETLPIPFRVSYMDHEWTFNVDVGEGGGETAEQKIHVPADSPAWINRGGPYTENGVTYYQHYLNFGQIGYTVPFGEDADFTVSPDNVFKAVADGFMGMVTYTASNNQARFCSLKGTFDYGINIKVKR